MAGNKYDTPFEKPQIEEYTLMYKGLYNTPITVTGDVKIIIKHLIDNL